MSIDRRASMPITKKKKVIRPLFTQPRRLCCSSAPPTAREVGDVIRIKRGVSKVDDVFTIINMTIPLDAESEMKIQTSQRRITG